MSVDYSVVKLPSGEKRYTRGSTNIVIPKGSEVEEYRILSHGNSVTPYFGIVLDPSIAVGPEGTKSIFMNFPADMGVFITNGKNYTMIDRVDEYAKKFALYGSASDGMIYRYVKSKYTKSLSKANKKEIPTEIVITNKSKSWQVISRVIFIGSAFDTFTDGKRIFGEKVHMNISEADVITTKLSNTPSVAGAKMAPYSATITKPGIKADTVEMRYGP